MTKTDSLPFKLLYYFRGGWGMYFAFIFAAINTLTVTYFLAIENYPELKAVFPSFEIYLLTMVAIGIPLLTMIGYTHYKRSPAYSSEAGIMLSANPYTRRALINSELNVELNIKISKILVKISNKEDTKKEMLELKTIHDKINEFVNERKFSNNKDLDYLKKMRQD
tara:strand:- start:1410 stop:1907 length:498 start_codon:yes stop_codon:yes gene_type:complete